MQQDEPACERREVRVTRTHHSEITNEVASKLGVPADKAKAVVNQFLLSVQDRLLAGEQVVITGFLTMGTRARTARKGRNPRTGETVKIPAGRRLFTKTSTSLKRDLNSKRKSRTRTRITASGTSGKAATPKKVTKKAANKKVVAKKAANKKVVAKKAANKKVVAKKAANKKVARKKALRTEISVRGVPPYRKPLVP
jgi:nucleoid DNA-binding protein